MPCKGGYWAPARHRDRLYEPRNFLAGGPSKVLQPATWVGFPLICGPRVVLTLLNTLESENLGSYQTFYYCHVFVCYWLRGNTLKESNIGGVTFLVFSEVGFDE